MKNAFFSTITDELATRAALSTLSLVSPASSELRDQLLTLMNEPAGSPGSFLASPVCEALFDWERAPVTMDALVADGLLPAELVAAMDAPPEKYIADRFARSWQPYRHQVTAWKTLSERDPKSVIVTTGTASGKTECFLVPILADMARELQRSSAPLEGVRALFLYPLNALINSQRDRLLTWTHAFGDRLRFCLYNGATPNEVPAIQQSATPSQVLSRELLRKKPSPILVTNATMLEFMMVRSDDTPIVERSKGKLRWIVLDEAHTYVGSTAAEIALLLRRVLHAFGVSPSDVRFVATSATIGTGEETKKKLQHYLADLAGVPTERVVVVDGLRSRPALPSEYEKQAGPLPKAAELAELPSLEVAKRLAASSHFRAARTKLQESPQRIEQVAEVLGLTGASGNHEAIALMDHASRASFGDEQGPVLPLRMHLFMRTQQGLYGCCNTQCPGRPSSKAKDWNFGRVYLERRNRCEHCQSLVFPVNFCSGCGEAYLSALEETGRLIPADWSGQEIDADEALESDETDTEAEGTALGHRRLIAGPNGRDAKTKHSSYDPTTGEIGSSAAASCVLYEPPTEEGLPRCGRCGEKERSTHDVFRPVRAGAPFFLGVAIPSILGQLPFDEDEARRPAAGRKLITFTDSRGGTARFALKTQLEAERNYVRARIYHLLWSRAAPATADNGEEAELREQISRPGAPAVVVRALKAQLEAIESGRRAPELRWEDARIDLANDKVVSVWMRESLLARYPGVKLNERDMADIVMLRELMRRPKRQNSLETLGLVRLKYPALERAIHSAPPQWTQRGYSVEQWTAFLGLVIDFFVRSHGAVSGLDNSLLRWMGIRFGQPEIVPPNSSGLKNVAYPWPSAVQGRRPHRITRLLALALKLDLKNEADRVEVNDLLERAWKDVLQSRLLHQGATGFRLDLNAAVLTPLVEGFICPITRRVLPSTLLGFSPFQTERWASTDPCVRVEMPRLKYPFGTEDGRSVPEKVRDWLQHDASVVTARAAGVWTDFSDRIVSFPDSLYFQTGEHSAQQSKQRLEQLESSFRSGFVNVLSCSTTMEMGVNLGGLMAVALNNTPPGPANYLQRAGRAARRQQPRAVAFTLCQGSAHGEAVFKDPTWPFTTPLNVPAVSLRSDRIVVRHIHSLLLSYFLRHSGMVDAQRLTCGAFLVDEGGGSAPVDTFLAWIEADAPNLTTLAAGLDHLLARTSLDGARTGIFEGSVKSLAEIRDRWRGQYDALHEELSLMGGVPKRGSPGFAVAKAVAVQLDRLTDEYLLRFLATEGFLPAYGFPLHVVPFVTTTAEQLRSEREQGEDSYGQVRGYPSRHVSQALNEYAPGNSVVLDGVVYKSSGVTLSWHRPPSDGEQREIQAVRRAWRCRACGAANSVLRGMQLQSCARCGNDDIVTVPYLVPSGFAVDIRDTPHNDLSQVEYIPRIPAWLSAGSKPWANLSTSAIGRYRYDSEGFVFHHSRGLLGHGYAICLHCGYVAAETQEPKASSAAELPKGFAQHRRLRGGKNDDQGGAQCVGSSGGFGVLRHHHLGSDARTDVIELQLALPSGTYITDQTTTTSLAVALREALARELNIDVREIGWHVQPGVDPKDGRQSILLFDVAEGGAGYVGVLPDILPQLLRRAQQFLTCPRCCDTACHACLLAYDTADAVARLNRRLALGFLSNELILSAALPPSHRVFGETTRFESTPLLKACLLRAQQAGLNEVRIYTDGTGEEASLDPSWQLWPFLVRWKTQNCAVRLVVTKRLLNALTWQEKNALANQLEGTGLELRQVDEPVMVADRLVALEMGATQRSSRWAVSNIAMLCPGEDWGEPTEHGDIVAVHREETLAPCPGQLLAPSDIRVAVPGTVVAVNAGTQLNGVLNGFGSRLFGQIGRQAPALMGRLKEAPPLASIVYSDRYLRSPLSVRLLAEVLRHIGTLPGGVSAETKVQVKSTFDYRGSGPTHGMTGNWPTAELQRQVTVQVMQEVTGKPVTVEISEKNSLPHYRFLRMQWSDGRSSEIRFDQGLSGMQIAGRAAPFDTARPVARQALDLARVAANIEPVSSGSAPIYVFQP
jgi:DEAD/DEAH box helicase domain-containing protein